MVSTEGAKAQQDAEADRFLIHARVMESILIHARADGVDAEVLSGLLARFGLSDVRTDGFDTYVSMNRLAQLSRALGKVLGNPAIGLSQAQHSQSGSIGVVDNAMVTSPDMETAIDVLCRYMRLYADVSFAGLEIEDETVALAWVYSPLIEASDVLADRAAMSFVLRMQDLFGEDWRPKSIHLQRAKPKETAAYVKAFGPAVNFGADVNRVIFNRKDLARTNRVADPYAHEVALALANRMISDRKIPDDLSIRAREDVWHHLADGQATITETARRLGTSTRSLQRRLDELGTSYQKLSDEVRQARARHLLTQSSMPVGDIAYELGFSNQANLTRAVKRWFGMSPRTLRQTQS